MISAPVDQRAYFFISIQKQSRNHSIEIEEFLLLCTYPYLVFYRRIVVFFHWTDLNGTFGFSGFHWMDSKRD
jgi:hypothetical protein